MHFQHTLGRSVSVSGVGLHSGQTSTVTLSPAPVDTGIVFFRKTNGHVETCQASIRNLRPMQLCTSIGSKGFQVQTIEHILSALWGLGLDNAQIEITSEEVPVLDGSAAPFVQLIQAAGMIPQGRPRTYLKILQPLYVGNHQRSLSIVPSPFPRITYTISYDHHLIQHQTYEYDWATAEFKRDIAEARTFAFSHEVESLWARGLGQGGSLDNTIVFSEDGVLNEDGLRFPDECVRHKVLDLIGDLSLLGLPVIGHIIAERSGHHLHAELVQAILDNPDAWTLLGTQESHRQALADIPHNGHGRQHAVSLAANSAL